MISIEGQRRRSAPTPGCVCKRCASGHLLYFLLDGLRQLRDHWGQSVEQLQQIPRRRRLAHGANRNDSSCSRPASRHNRFLQRSPFTFSATDCNWFMIRVRALAPCDAGTCHSSCRRSRFSQFGTQIWRKVILQHQPAISAVHPGDPSSACAPASHGSPLHPRSTAHTATRRAVVSSNQRACPLCLHPHAHLDSLCRQITVELLRFLMTVLQSPLL